jgi:hypothetical protein
MSYGLLVALIIWIPVEALRLWAGYKGNINETFPDLILFLGLSVCVLILDFVPFVQYKDRFPHEFSCAVINCLFTLFELVFGFAVGLKFIKTHFASFKLRTAPIIDKNFQHKYAATAQDIKSKREIELGTQKLDKRHDNMNPFHDSNAFLKVRVR